MCKNVLRSDGQQQSYSKAKFSIEFELRAKNVSETGPWTSENKLQWYIHRKLRTNYNQVDNVNPQYGRYWHRMENIAAHLMYGAVPF